MNLNTPSVFVAIFKNSFVSTHKKTIQIYCLDSFILYVEKELKL
ncbi:hypothetical protein QEW_1366 [Clostridioides difficile CD160]|nr:hypothetical protein QEW_1366 [Clostridioides difficile CD160]